MIKGQEMKKMLFGASALALLAGMTGAAQAEFALTILHFNDFHSRFESITGSDSNCDAEGEAAGECFGGIARLKTAIDTERAAAGAAGENVVLLSAGDEFQGSLFYTQYKSEIVSDFLNDLDIDVAATGNHEFDDGPAEFAKYIDAAEHPIIGGNFDVSGEPLLAGKITGVVVLDIGGERIGVIGALAEDTPETSSPGDTVVFQSATEYITGAADALTEAGVNKIILLSHVGLSVDQQIAAAVSGVDLIVGGHSHTLLSNTHEGAAGPYPTLVANPDGVDVPIVQAGAYAKYLGKLKVTWDDAGNVVSAEGNPILLDASVTPDQGFLDRVAVAAGPLEELKAQVVGTATAAIEGSREVCRATECAMGNLVADALLARVADQGITIAIQNGGGLRASIDAGEVTMGEVLTVLPFSNTLATFQLSGADILASLENGLSDIENGAGRFPQVAGLKYSFDKTQPSGARLVGDVEVMENGNWVPLDPAKTYGVVTNNYMRGGGDGYELFSSNAQNAYDFGPPLEQVVADYIAAQGGSYTPYTDGRISDVSPAAPAEPAAEEAAPAEAPATEAPAMAPEAEAPAADAPATGGMAADAPAMAAEQPAMASEEAPAMAAEQPAMATEAPAMAAEPVVPAVPAQ
jgi:5'-nucleotidase / UDP-sugar diphosphatase